MATSISLTIATQIVADFTASGLLPAFTAERRILPRNELKGLAEAGPKVLITPSNRQGERNTRGDRAYTHSIDVAVLAKVTVEESTEQEELDNLVENLSDWYYTHPLGNDLAASLDNHSSKFFDSQLLLNDKIFLVIITLNFLHYRE